MQYTTVLFDIDHTLFDFDTSERHAFDSTLRSVGLEHPEELQDAFTKINDLLWKRVELGELTPNYVGTQRWVQLAEVAGISVDPGSIAATYISELGAHGDLYPGARDMLDEVRPYATLALLSNGIGAVQRARIARLEIASYFDAIVISGEVGSAKPAVEIFDFTFEQLGWPNKANTLMIGDNLTSDIQGGLNYGIDTCWYTPEDPKQQSIATHQVLNLSDIPQVVRGP